MFESDDRLYYEKRAAHATELCHRASDPKIASLHQELALRYELLSVEGSRTTRDAVVVGAAGKGLPPQRAEPQTVINALRGF